MHSLAHIDLGHGRQRDIELALLTKLMRPAVDDWPHRSAAHGSTEGVAGSHRGSARLNSRPDGSRHTRSSARQVRPVPLLSQAGFGDLRLTQLGSDAHWIPVGHQAGGTALPWRNRQCQAAAVRDGT